MKTKFLALAVLTAIAFTSDSGATTLLQLETPDLTNSAKWIQIGEVAESWAAYDPAHGMIFTYSRLRVDRTIKGAAAEEMVVRQPGGRAGGLGMVVHGTARFNPGERALLFLRQDQDGAPSVVGMAQGKFRIYRSRVTGEEMALLRAPADFSTYSDPDASGKIRRTSAGAAERRVPLRRLIDEIRNAMEEERRRQN